MMSERCKIAVAWYGELNAKLLAMVEKSVRANAPECPFEVLRPERHAVDAPHRFEPKMVAWTQAVHRATGPLLLIDADVIVRRDPSIVFESTDAWDIAHAPRPGDFPYNTGVVFVRPTTAARAFFDYWLERTRFWGASKASVMLSKKLHGGVDQCSFAEAVARHHGRVKELPYDKWNLCQEFELFNPRNTAILHLKGHVSRDLLSGRNVEKYDMHLRKEVARYVS